MGTTSDDGPPAVAVEGVRRTYTRGEPVHAVDGVSLELPEGSFTAIMGPSGSGKSTLMNCIGCLDTPDEGVVRLAGRDVTGLSETEKASIRGREVGFVFQTFNLIDRLTAAENVALPLAFGSDIDSERADELLGRVGLGDRVDHRPSELSGGQRQRVAIARALVNDPAVVLADEPTGNLDTDTGSEIMDLLRELNEAGTTVVVVTHERAVAERADRIVHLVDGEIERVEEL